MSRYVYMIWWSNNTPPLSRNLAVANRRLKRADPNAPELTANGEIYRWNDPSLTATDVYRILLESNANPGYVKRAVCDCEAEDRCDPSAHHRTRIQRGMNEDDERCNWLDERRWDECSYRYGHMNGLGISRRKIGRHPFRYVNRRLA
jgi:hypothetical protein